MKKILLWLLVCLLLAGCGAVPQETEATVPSAQTEAAQTLPPEGFYEAGSALEVQTREAVKVYPLEGLGCDSVAVMGENILLFFPAETGGTLTLLTGDTLYPAAAAQLEFSLSAQEPSLLADGEGLSFYDRENQVLVVLDEALREITRIPAPENMLGTPLLSPDRSTLYYCTESGVYAMDLETRIPQLLRQMNAEAMTLEGVLQEGSLLQCSVCDETWNYSTLFLSTQTGQLVREVEGLVEVASSGSRYAASFLRDELTMVAFGEGESAPQTLYTGGFLADCRLLPGSYGILDICAESGVTLNYYDLSTGKLQSTLTLEEGCYPSVADGGNGVLWLLYQDAERGCPVLCRWDTKALPSGDESIYTGNYYSRSNPDLAGIAQCQELARQIGERHGVEVLVWEDAIAVQPWDYHLTEEYLVPILTQQLELLDGYLGNFPEGFLAQLSDTFSGLTICLVRQLEGSADAGSLDTASGIQFWEEDHAYIALSTLSGMEHSLYHELCHVIDGRVFSQSNAYDQWESLNPSGFEYDYDYIANASRNAGEYLRDAERCFIDTYSMSYPKEDRARILEYAMTEGNESYFQSKVMQSKLKQICVGIREAFGLKKSAETFLWEQYLAESLAYSK